MFIRKSEKKGIITLGILTMALFVLPRTIHKSEYPVFLIPYSRLSDTTQTVSPKPLVIELNSADSTALVSIRTLAHYASKILRYREQLGGFHATRQLKEIKFQYLNIDSLLPHFSVNPALIRKKELDTMSFKSVLHHPYLEYEDVQLIFNAKRKFGKIDYSTLESQKILPLFKLKKIKPYFK
ncbi:MAG: helix-hairpin-helix domain-containing protein [Butyricimonas faecihominis]